MNSVNVFTMFPNTKKIELLEQLREKNKADRDHAKFVRHMMYTDRPKHPPAFQPSMVRDVVMKRY